MSQEPEMLTRRERERRRKREEILAAALAVFSGKGFSGGTMAEISRTAEYPLATIYKFFEGKDRLFKDLIVAKAEELAVIIREAGADTSVPPLERLRRCIAAKAAFYARNRDAARLFLSVRGNAELGAIAGLVPDINRTWMETRLYYSELLAAAIGSGELVPCDALELAALLMDITTSAAWRWAAEDDDKNVSVEKRLETALTLFLDGARARG